MSRTCKSFMNEHALSGIFKNHTCMGNLAAKVKTVYNQIHSS